MATTSKIPRREFLQLADTFDPDKHRIGGFYVSEKLDGTRCFWDGGLTRGMKTVDVPWASVTDPKTGNRKAKIKPRSTGLWSRYGNPICATEAFLNSLPSCPLDGELWAGRGNFQLCRSICAGDEPDPRFDQISYAVYSTPALPHIFKSGEIKNANFRLMVSEQEIQEFVLDRLNKVLGNDYQFVDSGANFDRELLFLRGAIESQNDNVFLHQQIKLPEDHLEAEAAMEEFLAKVLDKGGEGVIIRNHESVWTPRRHCGILKYKPYSDDEGILIGFTAGRETDKGSKHRGKIGALILDYNGKRLELSGLTDTEREFETPLGSKVAFGIPGQDMPSGYAGKHFKIGQTITFLYRELSDGKIPKEARYLRPRDVE